jgi:Ni/Fe-hydrogenase 1 B-type cytochrome subunit
MPRERLRTYAWEVPVRLTHWISVLCIVSFTITGFYIADPYVHAVSSDQYIMGWMRFIHFVTGYVFLIAFIVRLYWGFVGNRYSSWRVWIPLTGRQWKDLWSAISFYLFISKQPPYSVGHTALAGVTYLVVFLLFAFQIVSGFALYSVTHQGAIWTLLGGWLTGVMSFATIRMLHHLIMYVLLAFTVVHVYIGWYLDLKERNGLMGSIFDGYKFVTGKEWE